MFQHMCPHHGFKEIDLKEAEYYLMRGFEFGFQCKVCDEEGAIYWDNKRIITIRHLSEARDYIRQQKVKVNG